MTTMDRLTKARAGRWALAAATLGALLLSAGPALHAEGRQRDSDDYICNHGAPDDPTTIEACGHLRGTTRGMLRDISHQRDNDDYNCNHGAPDDPGTIEACGRLRGTTRGMGRDIGHQRDNDDYVCHHGAPGDPATVEACAHLRGYAVGGGGRYSVVHILRDFPTTQRDAAGRAFLSARYTLELNCAAGERRRIAFVRYAGRHGGGGRVSSGRVAGSWRAIPPGSGVCR